MKYIDGNAYINEGIFISPSWMLSDKVLEIVETQENDKDLQEVVNKFLDAFREDFDKSMAIARLKDTNIIMILHTSEADDGKPYEICIFVKDHWIHQKAIERYIDIILKSEWAVFEKSLTTH